MWISGLNYFPSPPLLTGIRLTKVHVMSFEQIKYLALHKSLGVSYLVTFLNKSASDALIKSTELIVKLQIGDR